MFLSHSFGNYNINYIPIGKLFPSIGNSFNSSLYSKTSETVCKYEAHKVIQKSITHKEILAHPTQGYIVSYSSITSIYPAKSYNQAGFAFVAESDGGMSGSKAFPIV
ncbi:MAG: hypothetical protein IT238_07120 [Bacteroidia bacterium]|nr:hypothetical protein [Bacteroidia bacterium]MCZ2247500.1 hypothetical protein [Bacteroidia bacterium]